ncbi:uncharacterized protein LOC115937574 [Leptonychotes weddellii]|uniref:Uncharacterized protein LOC115937574 n=1 Tax=Leptonychotes weddellii TaxID=9713 RepID=A0A7F8Q399_LEPWE|nr:uncharacterized protein LOC115937574 [Leptonychotes weddellii]
MTHGVRSDGEQRLRGCDRAAAGRARLPAPARRKGRAAPLGAGGGSACGRFREPGWEDGNERCAPCGRSPALGHFCSRTQSRGALALEIVRTFPSTEFLVFASSSSRCPGAGFPLRRRAGRFGAGRRLLGRRNSLAWAKTSTDPRIAVGQQSPLEKKILVQKDQLVLGLHLAQRSQAPGVCARGESSLMSVSPAGRWLDNDAPRFASRTLWSLASHLHVPVAEPLPCMVVSPECKGQET